MTLGILKLTWFEQVYWNVLYLAVIGAGAIFTGLNPGYSAHEMADHLQMVEARVIIAEPAMLEKTLAASRQCSTLPTSRIFAFDIHEPFVHPEIQSWSTLLQYGEGDIVPCPNPETTVAAYQTTSGTSGLPKAAMIPHSYLIVQGELRVNRDSVNYEVSLSVSYRIGMRLTLRRSDVSLHFHRCMRSPHQSFPRASDKELPHTL